MKCGGLGIPNPRLLADRAYNISKSASEVLVGSLLGGTYINYVAHKWYVCRASSDRRKHQKFLEMEVLMRQKELANGAGLNFL